MRRSNESHYNERSSENSPVYNSNQVLSSSNRYEPQNSRNVSYDNNEPNYHHSYSRKDEWKMREKQSQRSNELYSNHNNNVSNNEYSHRNQRGSYGINPEYDNSTDWEKQNSTIRSNRSQSNYNVYENESNPQRLTHNDYKERSYDRGNNFLPRENRLNQNVNWKNQERVNQNTETLRYRNRDQSISRGGRGEGGVGGGDRRDNRNFQRQLTSLKIFDLPNELFDILSLSKLVGKYGQVIKIIINPDRTSWIRFKSFQCARRTYKNLIDLQEKYQIRIQWPYLRIKERSQDQRRLKDEEENNFGKIIEPKTHDYEIDREIKDLVYEIKKSIKNIESKYQKQKTSSSSSSRSSHSSKNSKNGESKKSQRYSKEDQKRDKYRSPKKKSDQVSSSEQDVEDQKDQKKRRSKREEKKYEKRRHHNSLSNTESKSKSKNKSESENENETENESKGKRRHRSEYEDKRKRRHGSESGRRHKVESGSDGENGSGSEYEDKRINKSKERHRSKRKTHQKEIDHKIEQKEDVSDDDINDDIDEDREGHNNQELENEMEKLYDFGINKDGLLIEGFKINNSILEDNFILKLQERQHSLYLLAIDCKSKDQKQIILNASYSLQQLIQKEIKYTLNLFENDDKKEMETENENQIQNKN
ncbi:broad-complex core protein isoform [Anaeramoeba flamelloides]|uniref:Broad-complex core protein isoform n=1 Tax=Anaeramoeba flamelloides TaxID=1746091 RepID=A0AAV7Y522_9EUKA|nr:broad-complex core protein isoform [Anaeramoeba flamelloides]